MAEKDSNRKADIDKLMEGYLAGLPGKEHTAEEQEKVMNEIASRVKLSDDKRHAFEVISDSVRKLISSPIVPGKKTYLRPALAAVFLVLVVSTIGILLINDTNDTIDDIALSENKAIIPESTQQELIAENETSTEPPADSRINNVESQQLDFLPLRINSRAFSETKDNDFISNSELFDKLISTAIEVFKKYNVTISKTNKNEYTSEWIYMREDGKTYRLRTIFRKIEDEHPGMAIIEQRSLVNEKKDNVIDIDIRKSIKDIKKFYYNHNDQQ